MQCYSIGLKCKEIFDFHPPTQVWYADKTPLGKKRARAIKGGDDDGGGKGKGKGKGKKKGKKK